MNQPDHIPTEPPSTQKWKGATGLSLMDWAAPGVIVLFAIVVIHQSFQIKLAPEALVGDSMQPRSFPIFLMILVLLLSAVHIASMLLKGTGERKPLIWQTWTSMALFAVFTAVTLTLDMFLALAIAVFCLSVTFGERRIWVASTVAIATPVIIFFAFDLGFGVRFPRGILTELYY